MFRKNVTFEAIKTETFLNILNWTIYVYNTKQFELF